MALSINLDGRVILVCGASLGGIAGVTVQTICAAGAKVVAVDRTQDILDDTIEKVSSAGWTCHGIVADLTDPAQTDPLIETACNKFGRLDGVVNVAGGSRDIERLPLELTPTQMFRETLNLNFEYVFRICRDAAASMIKRNVPGSIVNFGSISSLTSSPHMGPYGAAKSAIAALTRTMAYEWAQYGVRANTVQPGTVATQRSLSRMPPEKAAEIFFTSPNELANTVAFLLSDLASGISGQTISVDSGVSARFCSDTRPFQIAKRNPQT